MLFVFWVCVVPDLFPMQFGPMLVYLKHKLLLFAVKVYWDIAFFLFIDSEKDNLHGCIYDFVESYEILVLVLKLPFSDIIRRFWFFLSLKEFNLRRLGSLELV